MLDASSIRITLLVSRNIYEPSFPASWHEVGTDELPSAARTGDSRASGRTESRRVPVVAATPALWRPQGVQHGSTIMDSTANTDAGTHASAELADVTPRTVQRVEASEPSGVNTRRARARVRHGRPRRLHAGQDVRHTARSPYPKPGMARLRRSSPATPIGTPAAAATSLHASSGAKCPHRRSPGAPPRSGNTMTPDADVPA